ncbi:hypothetical protein AV530_016301 [Patagioenas fasciata monilis]|uniref:Uncharacterized protein n=1 Tax=Patagioenas fasciata monilis TaxID=372326 RepID=A0A1V4JWR0_PATFA|nr:hypothetical protein AV530_016301 [Patagioenas fasciata monilis]
MPWQQVSACLLLQSPGVAKPCENLPKGEGGHKDIAFFSWTQLGRWKTEPLSEAKDEVCGGWRKPVQISPTLQCPFHPHTYSLLLLQADGQPALLPSNEKTPMNAVVKMQLQAGLRHFYQCIACSSQTSRRLSSTEGSPSPPPWLPAALPWLRGAMTAPLPPPSDATLLSWPLGTNSISLEPPVPSVSPCPLHHVTVQGD